MVQSVEDTSSKRGVPQDLFHTTLANCSQNYQSIFPRQIDASTANMARGIEACEPSMFPTYICSC